MQRGGYGDGRRRSRSRERYLPPGAPDAGPGYGAAERGGGGSGGGAWRGGGHERGRGDAHRGGGRGGYSGGSGGGYDGGYGGGYGGGRGGYGGDRGGYGGDRGGHGSGHGGGYGGGGDRGYSGGGGGGWEARPRPEEGAHRMISAHARPVPASSSSSSSSSSASAAARQPAPLAPPLTALEAAKAAAQEDTEEEEAAEGEAARETEAERCERLLLESRARREAIKQRHGGAAPAAAAAAAAAEQQPPPQPAPAPDSLPAASSAQPPAAQPTAPAVGGASSSSSSSSSSDAAGAGALDMFDWAKDDEEWVKAAAAAAALGRAGGSGGGGGGGGGAAAAGESSDGEGYFRPRIGELLAGRYLVQGVLGRGAFSCVLYCKDTQALSAEEAAAALAAAAALSEPAPPAPSSSSSSSSSSAPPAPARGPAPLLTGVTSHVALKVVNNREPMRKAGEREVAVLRALGAADPAGRCHTVRLQHVCAHGGHLCLAFEPLAANLKEVADKFGVGVGVPLGAVRVYGAQLLAALGLVGRLGYVHGDLKPHNILASEDYRTLKLGDFGSAFAWASEPDAHAPQPYVGSRFYRAPEAVLGARCAPAWDMWSAGCLLYELYTGAPLFAGADNNDMLWRVQALRGPFPHRLLRRHVAACAELGTEAVELHFEPGSLAFRRRVADPVTGERCVKLVDVAAPRESLGARLQASRAGDSRRAVADFQALLEHMLVLDPARRCTVAEALASAFIKGSG